MLCDSFPTETRSSPVLPGRAPTFRKMGIFAAMELLEHVQHQDSTQDKTFVKAPSISS